MDLSGGIDSRSTCSLFLPYLETDLLKERFSIFCDKGSSGSEDYRVSSAIASDLGFELSSVYTKATRHALPSLEKTFERWENNRLGQYYLGSYITTSSIIGEDCIRCVGVGGEQFRPFYHKWAKDLDQYLKGRRRFFPKKPKPKKGFFKFYLARMRGENVDLFEQFSKRVHKSIKQVTRENNPLKQDELTQHYREFRSRFHLGVPATEMMTIAPLSGALMDRLAAAAPYEYLENKQIYYDIMANSCPRLLELPFDDEEKAPTQEHLDRITIVDASNFSAPSEALKKSENGKTYTGNAIGDITAEDTKKHLIDQMEEMLRRVVDGRKHCPDSIKLDHENEISIIKEAVPKGRLPDGKQMKYFHFISLCENVKKFDIS